MARARAASVVGFLLCWVVGDAAGQRQTPSVRLVYPNGLALDRAGALYISDIGTHQIVKLAEGALTLVAGSGSGGFGGDGGPAINARLFAPHALAIDAQGDLIVADTFNHRIRRIDRRGAIATIAGNGVASYTGDGGPAIAAGFNGPQDVALDRDGNIFVADTYNAVVRRIDRAGIVTTVAGSEPGLGGDGGPALMALINMPSAIAVGSDGALYVSDAANSRIRRVAPDGTIQTIAGDGGGSGLGGAGFSADGTVANRSKLFSAMGLQFDAAGHLFICDSGNNRVRVVRDGAIATVAGSSKAGFAGDGGKATTAMLNTPQKIALASDGRLFVADRANGRVRVVTPTGLIGTVAGDGNPKGILTDAKQ